MLDRNKLKYFIENEKKNSFVQSPKKWFIENGYADCIEILGDTLLETKQNLFTFVYGPTECENCKKFHTKLLSKRGWKGWAKNCSEKCENERHSKRQIGNKNSSHRMSTETKNNMREKMSMIMKEKVKNGSFTPKSENYKSFGMIEYKHGKEIRKVRSLWEMIYWLQNKHLEYEKIRIEYYDSEYNRDRIYITDFYDCNTNTIIEVKPIKYQDIRYREKKDAAISQGYNFITIDETYFEKYKKDDDLLLEIETNIINYDKIRNRIKWLK